MEEEIEHDFYLEEQEARELDYKAKMRMKDMRDGIIPDCEDEEEEWT